MPERIGLYGGSFNPVHFGHLNLAIEMLEKHKLTKVYFCPAALNPFKSDQPSLAAPHRLSMLKLALEDIPEFSILENELFRPAPSYTIQTIEELLASHSGLDKTNLFLIVGADALPKFHLWHQAEQIIKNATVLSGGRSGFDASINGSPELQAALKAGWTQTKIIDISSSEIRMRISKKKYCRHLLPTKVLDYIYAHGLYYDS